MFSDRKKRLVVWIVIAAVLTTLALSEALIAHEADHDCAGEGCLICRTVRTVSEISVCLLITAAVFLLFAEVLRFARLRRNGHRRCVTPVSLCVKLVE